MIKESTLRNKIKKRTTWLTKIKIINMTTALEQYALDTHTLLAKMTKNMDYGCNFNSKGKCAGALRYPSRKKKMCCCEGCQSNVGYFSRIPEHWLSFYAEHWNPGYGFWGKNGCQLPREYRSGICLSHVCTSAKPPKDDHVGYQIRQILAQRII